MKFTSYAQNFEDVLLWRALQHIKNGFYIDVGASDPDAHSVTKAFYERGWWGINIEPLPEFRARFAAARPRDINLSIAAGAREDRITLFDVPAIRGWASSDPAVAQRHRDEGHEVVALTVPVRRLVDICREHVTGDIHFLKIDVEGFEAEVLRGMDFAQWRPWIVVVEATLPNSRVTNHEQWEQLVTAHDYLFAYFDGLNRYYVAHEHRNLLDALHIQPNVFDDFVTVHLVEAWEQREAALQAADASANLAASQAAAALAHAAEAHSAHQSRLAAEAHFAVAAEARQNAEANYAAATAARLAAEEHTAAALEHAADSHARADTAEACTASTAEWAHGLERQIAHMELYIAAELGGQISALHQQIGAMHAQAEAVRRSLSWRVTHPIRVVGYRYHHHFKHDPFWRAIPRRLRAGVAKGAHWLASREWLRRVVIPRLARMPWLDTKLTHLLDNLRGTPTLRLDKNAMQVPEHLRLLPASARTVLADLGRVRGTARPPAPSTE